MWDLDGKEYTDMSIMGIGTNILGYGHPEVDESVMHNVQAGNMSTLNCPEEVFLAEKLIELHPWGNGSFCSNRWRGECYCHPHSTSCVRKRQCSDLWLSWLARLVSFSKFGK